MLGQKAALNQHQRSEGAPNQEHIAIEVRTSFPEAILLEIASYLPLDCALKLGKCCPEIKPISFWTMLHNRDFGSPFFVRTGKGAHKRKRQINKHIGDAEWVRAQYLEKCKRADVSSIAPNKAIFDDLYALDQGFRGKLYLEEVNGHQLEVGDWIVDPDSRLTVQVIKKQTSKTGPLNDDIFIEFNLMHDKMPFRALCDDFRQAWKGKSCVHAVLSVDGENQGHDASAVHPAVALGLQHDIGAAHAHHSRFTRCITRL